jgi:phage-related protein
MTSRNYDFIVTVSNAYAFQAGNVVFGLSSQTTGVIANVNYTTNQLKIKIDNVMQEFANGEAIVSNVAILFNQNVSVTYSNTSITTVNGNNYILNGSTNTFAIPAATNSDLVTSDAIAIKFGANVLPATAFVYPSATLGRRGVDIKPILTEITTIAPENKTQYSLAQYQNQYGGLLGTAVWAILGNKQTDINAGLYYSNTWVTVPTANQSSLTIQIVQGDTAYAPFVPSIVNSHVETANSTITAIAHSPYIAAKNAFEQKPLVRLYTVYFPGEWYPPNRKGNPTNEGSGRPWPFGFPYRFAEIRGDLISDLQYNVTFGSQSYVPYPIDSTGISLDSSGKINQVQLTMSNYDNLITQLVENPFLVGNNKSNAVTGIVNGESVTNLDPRTVVGHAQYNQDIVDSRGGINLAFDYDSTRQLGGTWTRLKQDTRDLLGAVVEIKSTFANFLKFWPEYSTVRGVYGNAIQMYVTYPYRNGDKVCSNANTAFTANVISVRGDFLITDNPAFGNSIETQFKIYIVNDEYDEDNYVLDNFKVESLQNLDEKVATFSLTSWLQYFKLQLPKRRYLKNTCSWVYKGPECQYPDSGTGTIPGDTLQANGFFNSSNETMGSIDNDDCSQDSIGCELRRNTIHYGAFPGTGRTIPR